MTVREAKQDICNRVNIMVGYEVVGLSDILSVIAGPDVLPLLKVLITEVEKPIPPIEIVWPKRNEKSD